MNQSSAQEFLAELPRLKEDLPYSLEVLKQLFAQTGDGSMASLEEVGDTLGRDQGLTARILSLANSAYYGLQSEVQSVQRAAAVLGMGEIRAIVVALGVAGLTDKHETPDSFDLDEYWRHQFLTGLTAKQLAQRTGVGAPDNLFTVGMLHDIGKLITALRRPDDWTAIRKLALKNGLSDSVAEDEYWGLDHAVVGSLTLKSWDLPSGLTEPVNWHHAPKLAPDHKGESALTSLADGAAHAAADGVELREAAVKLCANFNLESSEVVDMAGELVQSDDIAQFIRLLA